MQTIEQSLIETVCVKMMLTLYVKLLKKDILSHFFGFEYLAAVFSPISKIKTTTTCVVYIYRVYLIFMCSIMHNAALIMRNEV